ncbi:anti-sigma factor family protein [Microbulbifer sp.]|uniref:anti-sigma factor family protein n=1 Tax=Microbulbifer sp. TaxID=1908541 RepID=UPI003F2A8509
MMIRREKPRSVTREDLSAFADGQLSRAHSARVAAHLRANPEDADRVHAYWKREAELYRTFTSAREQAAEPFVPPRERRFPLYVGVAAALLVLAISVPWLWRDGTGQLPATAGVGAAGVQAGGHAGGEVAPTYAGLELQPQVDGSFALNGNTLEYHFTAADGASLTFYETDLHGNAGNTTVPTGGIAMVEWVDGGRHYALTGPENDARLIAMAALLRRQLTVPAPVTSSASAVPEAPAADPALQPVQEEIVPAGVSRM